MGMRGGFLVLLVLAGSLAFADARISMISDESVTQIGHQIIETESENSQAFKRNERLCTLCEQFATQAITYLGENQTQTEVIKSLHQACSRLHSFEEQCLLLVDYYAPLFFMEVGSVDPEGFCEKVNLCEDVMVLPQKQDSCEMCHHAMSEVLLKLKDPDTQLEIIEILLKACNQAQKYKTKCKKLVFEYGPLIMANAEQILEARDLCVTLRVCKANEKAPLVESF
ncbi:hypothetical protein QJS10_CPA07g01262 [Acorus calamus]|uniref:Pulmonary surfactant-associated protein B n=1 Tax=Acorus calamus TaxID=4465 RepID=A0AAV9EIZ7_ACOCL|nr:hypothetical protein QJS10_CPA07g01262 [Acorus calamus]